MKNKADLRAAIFSSKSKEVKVEIIELFGEKVEIRQPTLAVVNKLASAANNPNSKVPGIVRVLIEYCYVPGTNEKVFDNSDEEQLSEMPSGAWLNEFNEAIQRLTGVDVKAAEKNSDTTA